MSFGNDNLNQLINKIKKINPNKLFTNEIYKEFKRRLQPICYTFEQAIPIDYTPSQIKYFQSQDEQIKIKGIAGTGKTILLATRALSAYKKNKNVLILTFNITLKNYIRDKLSQINYLYHNNSIPLNQIEISNYHNFFLSQANNLNIELPYDVKDKKLYSDINIFQNQPTIKYTSIFIDEIQDYEKEWIYIIKNYFLEKNGEMVLFGDIAQNIYERVELLDENENKFNKIPLLNYNLYGFGRGWKTLIETKRTKSKKIFNLINDFTNNFITNKYKNQIPVDSSLKQQELFSDDHILIKDYDKNNLLFVANCIKAISKKLNLHPNDISIIASQKDILVNINEFFLNEKIQTTFAPIEVINKLQHKELIEKYERTLKVSFQMNSGCMKLSTIKSFKGLENLTVFYIHNENDKIEEIYTAITRAKKNLIIFINKKSKYYNYFLQHSSQ